jgi:hypothetical protein
MKRNQATHDMKAEKLREYMALVRQVPAERRASVLAAAKAILHQANSSK